MGFVSKKFIDTRTGEIVVQVPISEIAHFEEYEGHLEAGDVDQITADKLADEADTFGDDTEAEHCPVCGAPPGEPHPRACADWIEEWGYPEEVRNV